MLTFDNFYVVDNHRNMSTVVHVTNSDGNSDKWMVEVVKKRDDGEPFIIEVAADNVKKLWLQKLGYLLAKYTSKYLNCMTCISFVVEGILTFFYFKGNSRVILLIVICQTFQRVISSLLSSLDMTELIIIFVV
jgi:hypothetical protein